MMGTCGNLAEGSNDLGDLQNQDVVRSVILILTDDSGHQELITKLLFDYGFSNVVATDDPLTDLPQIIDQACDLIIMLNSDSNIAQMTYISRLNSHFKYPPPVLMLSEEINQLDPGIKPFDGIFDYVPRPFKYVQFLNRVRHLLQVRNTQMKLHQQNALLESQILKLQDDGANKQMQIVRHLTRVSAYRDEITGNHIKRMSRIFAVIGRAAGFSEMHCYLLLNAATMHDIGKIGIPDSILLKKGKLTDDEMLVMKTHTTIGANILRDESQCEVMKMAAEIAESHHEKWDGTGYPFGLQGTAIPLTGRITAIADVFDALTSARPYKKAWTFSAAANYIRNESAKHFDPELVELMIVNFTEITEIIMEYSKAQESALAGYLVCPESVACTDLT